MAALEIEHIRVRRGRLDIETAIVLPQLHVSEHAASRICALLPNLENHLCVNNGKGPRFGDEIVGTELAHLLEHVIIELQGQAYRDAKPRPTFTGHTSWLEELAVSRKEGIAVMRTTVTFANDLVALQSAKEAVELVNWACDGDSVQPPDVRAVLERIRSTM